MGTKEYPLAMYRRNEAKLNRYEARQASDAAHKKVLESQGWVETPQEAVGQESVDPRDAEIARLRQALNTAKDSNRKVQKAEKPQKEVA